MTASARTPSQNLNVGAVGPGYLGSAVVVERLVRDFLGRVLQANTEGDLHAACAQAAEVFLGHDPAYQPVPGWSGPGGLSLALTKRLDVPAGQYEGDMLKQGFARLATAALQIAKGYQGTAAQRKLDELIHYATALLIGTADTLYPRGMPWKPGA